MNAAVRALAKDAVPIKEIVRRTGCSRQTVRRIHRKKPQGKPMPKHVSRANAAKSEVRAHVEHVFARQKGPMALVIRTIGLARARVKIGLANLVELESVGRGDRRRRIADLIYPDDSAACDAGHDDFEKRSSDGQRAHDDASDDAEIQRHGKKVAV